jgi:hypothetical protein
MLHPDVKVFKTATGGRIPGLGQYRAVVEAVRLLRQKKRLDDQALAQSLEPYWQAWSSRKRQDGRPYDPANISWLTDWALNETIPGDKRAAPEQRGKAVSDKVERFLNKR